MSTIPKRIKVGPFRYKVTYRTPILADDNTRLSGQCDHTNLRIVLDHTSKKPRQFETFIHEALHAMDYVAHTDLREEQVAQLSMVLTAFLLDNGFIPAEGEQAA